MIHFLVNNDYQLLDARRHRRELAEIGLDAVLIEIPHTLEASRSGQDFTRVVRLPSPARAMKWLKSWRGYRKLPAVIAAELRPGPEDVLFFYTEFDLANHMVARHFKAAGARVYLLEDGGLGTYVPLSAPGGEPLTLKERIIAAMTRLLPGLGDTRFAKVNAQVYPWLPDELVDGLCVYRDIAPVRRLEVLLMEPDRRARVEPVRGRAIFLNQPMYDHFQTAEDYLADLDRILTALGKGFAEVFFKFHPRESAAWRTRIGALMRERHPGIQLIEERQPFEELASTWRPEVLASYFSTALLNMAPGIEPLFLYHLIPAIARQPTFEQTTSLLQRWGYRFAPTFDAVRTGYVGGLEVDDLEPRVRLSSLVNGTP